MQIKIDPRRATSGSVLVTTLVLAVILGLTLAGYLSWVRTQNVLVAESQAWNAALVHAEAGIEEGMAQINVSFGTNYASSAATNWGINGSGYGPRSHTFSNGSYSAIILPVNGMPGPTIISTGYAMVPLVGRQIARTVKVTTTCSSVFGNAITVRSNLTTKGQGLMVDSYDSTDPLHSTTNGMYDPNTRKAGGDINSTGGFINVQNAKIYGHLRTGPDGSYGIGQGWVGDLNWNVKGQIQPGYYEDDFNMDFKEVTPPFTSGSDLIRTDYKTNAIYWVGGGNYFRSGDFVLNQNERLIVQRPATIYVTGNFNMKSQNACDIYIEPGASLRLYVGTVDGAPVATSLTLVNTTGNAYSFQYYGLPSNTSLTWVGNNNYVGTIYAPEADFQMGGGGSDVMDFQGSCVSLSGTLNGHFNVHYDENLKRVGPPSGFIVASWLEL